MLSAEYGYSNLGDNQVSCLEKLTPGMGYNRNNIIVPTLLILSITAENPTDEMLTETLQNVKAALVSAGIRMDWYTVFIEPLNTATHEEWAAGWKEANTLSADEIKS